MKRSLPILLLLSSASLIYGVSTGQGPSFTTEPQDTVVRNGVPITAIFPCSYEASSDTNTTVTWYRNGVVIAAAANRIVFHPNGSLEFSFIVVGTDATISGINYYCVVSNQFGSIVSRTANVQLATFGEEWNVNAQNLPITNMTEVVMGETILLPCNPPAANPTPTVVWRRSGELLDTSDIAQYKLLASGDLIIANVDNDDITDGTNPHTYQCEVTNMLIFDTMQSRFTYVLNSVVRYSENLTVYDTLQPTYFLEIGTNAEVTCLATANDVNMLEYFFIKVGESLATNTLRPRFDGNDIDARSTLLITSVQEENGGSYQCLVRNYLTSGDSDVLDSRNFSIVVFARPSITSSPMNMTVYTGDSVTVQCETAGLPTPIVSYYVNASVISSDPAMLALSDLSVSDSGAYQCFAQNEYGNASTSWTLSVRDPITPVVLNRSESDGTVSMGNNLTITVEVSADPEPVPTWQLNEANITDNSTIMSIREYNTTACPITYLIELSVFGFAAVHSGNYTLTIENRAGDISFSFSRLLEVAADVISVSGTGDRCLILQEDTDITCVFEGVPKPTFFWYKEVGDTRTNITASDSEYTLVDNVLTVINVNEEDDAAYFCEATNTVNGEERKDTAKLDARICSYPTIAKLPMTSTAVVDEDLTIMCQGEGRPDVSYMWFYANNSTVLEINTMFSTRIRIGIEFPNQSFLTITGVNESDAGNYTCRATNSAGTTERTSVVRVVQTPSPSSGDSEDFPTYAIIAIAVGGAVILVVIVVVLICIIRYRVKSGAYGLSKPPQGNDEEDDANQPYNPQYESLPNPRPEKPPQYQPTPAYPSSSVISARTPVPYNSSSMMEMQKMSNNDLSKAHMYNYHSTSALTKQDEVDGMHQPRYDDFLSTDGQYV